MKTTHLIIALSLITCLPVASARADGMQSWCGNGCSSEDDGSKSGTTVCTDWQPGAEGQSCQAHAICSEGCTVWPTAPNAGIDALTISPQKAATLRGARTYQTTRPPVASR